MKTLHDNVEKSERSGGVEERVGGRSESESDSVYFT